MSIFTSRDPAGQAVAELGLITLGIASVHDRAFAAGVDAMERSIEKMRRRQYDCDLADARARADELLEVAQHAVRRAAALEAENKRLRAALEQRQAFIDRVRNGNGDAA